MADIFDFKSGCKRKEINNDAKIISDAAQIVNIRGDVDYVKTCGKLTARKLLAEAISEKMVLKLLDNKKITIDAVRIAEIFNEWYKRFTDNPENFINGFDERVAHIDDYGERCAAYFVLLDREIKTYDSEN